jgi:DNA polymerase elongation subunit (family B)
MKFYTNVQMIGDQFLVRGYDNGEYIQFREKYQPTLFVPSKKKSFYKTLDGDYVEPIKPGFVSDCREFLKKYSEVENFKIYGNERFIYQYISDKYPQEQIDFDTSKIRLVTVDIETRSENGFPDVESADQEILLITIQDYNTKEITTWGQGPFKIKQDNVRYIQFNNERDLLNDFINWWMANTPDVVTGWNIQLFDIPFITKRIDRVLGEKLAKRLSPWGLVSQKEVFIKGRKQIFYDIGGITQLDYLDLYKKFTYTNQESYRLDHIANVELGQKKLDHSEFDTFQEFYTNGWQKFVEYNIIDVELVDRLEDKMKLIELALTMAYDAKVNYNDVFYQVRMWDTIIYNYLKKKNIVIPPKEQTDKDEKYAGAYVKEPNPGVYDWVVSFDLNSLYPHLIMQYNISPETLIDERHPTASVERILKEEINFEMYKDYAVCANGAMYRKNKKGFLPELMEKMYGERVIFKKRMLKAKQEYEKTPTDALKKEIARCNNIQMAKKISLNSAYGAIGNQYLSMKRENIADRGIWTAKKRYILNVWNSEGVAYTEPKLKVMGIEAVKSSTPAPCRQMLKESFKIMMSGSEDAMIDYIDQCRSKFKKLAPEEISFPRSVSEVTKYKSSSDIYIKGTPIHVRGALLFNHYIKKENLTNKYSLIQNGEKIKFCYLKKPNIIHENVISFIQDFPRELNISKYVDYDLQFDKAFLEPLRIILDAIGWSVEKTATLEMFFS